MASPSLTSPQIPGYVAGAWNIDPIHSDVSFTVRHMMVSKVRGRFATFQGQINTAANFLESSVNASVDLASIGTNNEQRDAHIRSADFFEVEKYPTMTFNSTSVRADGEGYLLAGDLSLHGVTRAVEFALEFNGFTKDPYGGTRAGFSAHTQINRRDYGVNINMPMDGGGAVVGDKIDIALEVEAVLQA